MGIDLQKMKDYLDSEEGQKSMDEYFAKIERSEKILDGRLKKLNKYLETNSFDVLMDRMQKENGKEWEDRCYKKGYMPYPTNLLSLVISYIREYGREYNGQYEEDEPFLSSDMVLGNYRFQVHCGQGCFDRIYKLVDGKWEFFLQN